ncbi:hypothetical protein AC1031_002285 [Aphanomyces cochlioides]|nr:hypothetical protein AC1031_002285 [Aphanomyces cochlioides]
MSKDVALELWSWGLSDEVVEMYCSNNVGKTLVRHEREGFRCSEGDLLLILCHNMDDLVNSKAYLHRGNYALPPGAPGHVNWPGNGHEPPLGAPLPPGVDAVPPFALGRFVASFPRAVDQTNGNDFSVIYIEELATYLPSIFMKDDRFAHVFPVFSRKMSLELGLTIRTSRTPFREDKVVSPGFDDLENEEVVHVVCQVNKSQLRIQRNAVTIVSQGTF